MKTINDLNIKRGKFIHKNAYLCTVPTTEPKSTYEYQIIVLTNNKDEKVGGILRCDTVDIQYVIFPIYRGKKYLSTFIKSGAMQNVWYGKQEISVEINSIEDIDDFNKKLYLAKLTGYKLKNEKGLLEYQKLLA